MKQYELYLLFKDRALSNSQKFGAITVGLFIVSTTQYLNH